MATEVKIKIRAFPYYEDVKDPVTGEDRKVERIGTRGQVVSLSDIDLERAKRFDAVVEPDEEVEDPRANDLATSPDPVTASVEELSNWLQGEYDDQDGKPTVEEVIEAVDDDPDVAKKMLDAENHATGGQPRSTLVSELEVVAGE